MAVDQTLLHRGEPLRRLDAWKDRIEFVEVACGGGTLGAGRTRQPAR